MQGIQLSLFPKPKVRQPLTQIKYATPGATCPYCGETHKLDQLIWCLVKGGSTKDYKIGEYCLSCWIPYQVSVSKERKIIMTESEKPQTSTNEVHSLSQVRDATKPWTYTHAQVVDQPMVIKEAKEIETMYGVGYLCICEIDGTNHKVLLAAKALVSTLDQIAGSLPVRCKVVKLGKYYAFDDA